jgi:DNA (cytosine-5)-methyltransferase 1
MKTKTINTVDLFCGAGGATTGLEMALDRLGLRHSGLAINHWKIAVDTMKANHPSVDTLQMSIEEAVPADLVPGGRVDFLWASPSCTHHSRAKGGKPRSNQLRAQPELILTWLDQLFVRRLCVENVPEFVDWGPLSASGHPIESMKGSCFQAWLSALEARNYKVEWRVLNCADYGDATTRRRFFLQAVRKGSGRITWPEPSYAEKPDLFLKPWRSVRDCLDLDDLGTSIFNRKRPLSRNTLRRIAVGLKKFCGLDFLMDMLGSDCGDLSRVHSLSDPMPTQHSGGNRCAIVRPFLVRLKRHCYAEDIDRPLSSIQASTVHHALCQPLLLDFTHNGDVFPSDKPLGAQTTHDRFSLLQPLILGQQSCAVARPIDLPCPTIATAGAIRVATPLILDMSRPSGNDSGHVGSADAPIRTITTYDNMQLALPMLNDGRLIDIRLRMLKPSELAAAHSFPASYKLTGTRSDQVKQIGNSVPCRTAAAICEAALAS